MAKQKTDRKKERKRERERERETYLPEQICINNTDF